MVTLVSPVPKFANPCGIFSCQLRYQRDTSKFIVLRACADKADIDGFEIPQCSGLCFTIVSLRNFAFACTISTCHCCHSAFMRGGAEPNRGVLFSSRCSEPPPHLRKF